MSSQATLEKLLPPDITINGGELWDPQVHDDRVYDRIMRHGTLGVGESYMDGWWDSDSVDELVFKLGDVGQRFRELGKWGMMRAVARNVLTNPQSRSKSVGNAEHHYNIGNELYEPMLGATMAYSCGYWGGENPATTLDEAQTAKFDLITRKLGLEEGMRVLDVGCGWGGLAFYAAEQCGVEVVGITPASEQADFVRDKVDETGTRVTVLEQDFRDPIDGEFDRIMSVGMFEHVGPKNYKGYLERMAELLDDDGLFLLHTITTGNATTNSVDPWIEKYIFPGGRLPSDEQIAAAANGVFLIEDLHSFGPDYDTTLMAWHKNFTESWPELEASGEYDNRFKRMWDFYLLSSAGAFRKRDNNLQQIVFSENGIVGGYESVR